MTYIIQLQERVLAPWGPSSISAVAELVTQEHVLQPAQLQLGVAELALFPINPGTNHPPVKVILTY